MLSMPLNTKKQKDNQEPQNTPPWIIRTQGPFTRLIEKRTGLEVRNREGENKTSGTKAKEMVSVHIATICKDLSRQLDHTGC
jgi:hypothetical protein